MDRTIRENLDGEYLIIHANQFEEGIAFASEKKLTQIQLRGVIGQENNRAVVDFKNLESISATLKVISFVMDEDEALESVINFESIYSLTNLEKIHIQNRHKLSLDLSLFPKLKHLGSEYWKGISSFSKAKTLTSIVFSKQYTDKDLEQFSNLSKLEILHIYNSNKVESLKGIEKLSKLKELCLSRNRNLENIEALSKVQQLKRLTIEKCNKISDYSVINVLRNIENLEVDNFKR